MLQTGWSLLSTWPLSCGRYQERNTSLVSQFLLVGLLLHQLSINCHWRVVALMEVGEVRSEKVWIYPHSRFTLQKLFVCFMQPQNVWILLGVSSSDQNSWHLPDWSKIKQKCPIITLLWNPSQGCIWGPIVRTTKEEEWERESFQWLFFTLKWKHSWETQVGMACRRNSNWLMSMKTTRWVCT